MTTDTRTGSGSGGEGGSTATDLPSIEVPGGARARDRKIAPIKGPRAYEPLRDERWKVFIDRQRKEMEIDVLSISPPGGKLDELAKTALDKLAQSECDRLPENLKVKKEGAQDIDVPATLAKLRKNAVGAAIVAWGIASEVKKVTDRLNAWHMTDGRRWVLSADYLFLLYDFFTRMAGQAGTAIGADKIREIREVMGDDLGVADKLMLDLEEEPGPFGKFAGYIVDAVMARNHIAADSQVVVRATQQVRASI